MRLLQKIFFTPLRIIKWLFRHHPWITAVEILFLSVINAAIVYVLLYMKMDFDSPPISLGIVVTCALILGLLSVVFSSFEVNNHLSFDVNNYDVLSLTLREYLQSRGVGTAFSYVLLFGIFFFLMAVLTVIGTPILILYLVFPSLFH